MKIASWNINSLRKREQRLLDWLERGQPDVVCLQETKCDEQFPDLALSSVGYRAVFHGQKSYNGVAILARSDLEDPMISFGDGEDDQQARVIAATVGDLRVFSIYAPNGQAVGSPAFAYKLRWYERLRTCLARAQQQWPRVTACGDFNVAPEDRDTHDPALWRGAIMCSEEERAAFRTVQDLGFIDTLRMHHPEEGLFSWWDYRMLAFPKNRGLRIDQILASTPLADLCADAGIDREMRKGQSLPTTLRSGLLSSYKRRTFPLGYQRRACPDWLDRVRFSRSGVGAPADAWAWR